MTLLFFVRDSFLFFLFLLIIWACAVYVRFSQHSGFLLIPSFFCYLLFSEFLVQDGDLKQLSSSSVWCIAFPPSLFLFEYLHFAPRVIEES